ncbi:MULTISPECIES: two-component system regulatory protein YycI [Neobacillus]|jgi:regulatory protein YycI of two-component signal transduction system YycFG|uniref:Two-component system regulatory protein YycI n=1 Tax=Neobacillus sedimentimangrovi TaxID=2699460 RepID=A0ABS8QFL2_9BACI|nr:two-component system regulatory protein YycI [Neobacillus sedimentimangrovi]MCD4838024.1 two-component system regulatory protein YycI [Neobacillus sedimentimangrovi]
MDWSKIKTIFIITFLILDVYLLFQLMKIRDANKYEIMTPTSIEEKLKNDEIKFKELPKTDIKAQYFSAKPKIFNKEDLTKLKGQVVKINESGTSIISELEKPIQLGEKFEPSELASFVKENILYGDQYQFGERNEKKNTIIYYQQYENVPLYKNINGMIVFYYNSQNQIVSYQQTYLEEFEKLTEKEAVLPPLKAMETLHQKGELQPKSEITKVELGYSTRIQLAASQVLAPTWRIVVNDEKSLFVNAFEGKIIDFNSDENINVE